MSVYTMLVQNSQCKNVVEIKYDENKSLALSPVLFFLNFWNKWLNFKLFSGAFLI